MTAAPFTLGPVVADASSGLSYRLRQPVAQRADRCVVLLHGVGSNESTLLDLATGLGAETLVVFARGPLAIGPQQFAWFQVQFTPQGPRIAPEQAEHSRRALIELLAGLRSRYGVGAQSTVIAGFSQGGILSASVGLSAPDSVAGFAVLSGRILPELEPAIAPRAQLARLQAFVGHGQFDSKLPVDWAHRADTWLCDLGVPHTVQLYPIDHTVSSAMQADFVAWVHAVLPVTPAVSQ
ncbi:MAG: phospholipase [Rhodoferax sp.]